MEQEVGYFCLGKINQVRILIIGESPLVEGVLIGLEHDPLITLQQVRAGNDNILPLVTEYKPNAIIYQLGCPGIEEILSLIHLLPGVRIVGLDIASDHVLVIDSWRLDSPSMSELRQLIMSPAGANVRYGAPDQDVGRIARPAKEVDVLGLER